MQGRLEWREWKRKIVKIQNDERQKRQIGIEGMEEKERQLAHKTTEASKEQGRLEQRKWKKNGDS